MEIMLFDGDEPIGKVILRENLNPNTFGTIIPARLGIWRTVDGRYYACYKCVANERKIWAELITETEAKYRLIENQDEYAKLFGQEGIESIPCFEPPTP